MAESKNKEAGRTFEMSFAAIDPYYETNIIEPTEKEIRGKDFISWGDSNDYPDYLFGLYKDVTTLRTICNGIADYVVGEGVESPYMSGREAEELTHKLALDIAIYGGFALEIHRGLDAKIKKVKYLDIRNVRSDKDNARYFYSEDWGHTFGRVKFLEYSAFDKDTPYRTLDDGTRKVIGTSIYVFKTSHNQVYPSPMYAGNGCWAAEIEKAVVQYHLNSINNGFAGSYIINMNNGKPEDKQKEEIEENFREKYTGFRNAARPVLCWNKDKDHQTEIVKIESDDFGDRYQALQKSSKQEIYSAFRAHPVIFGLPTEGTGFNDQDFQEAFKLFNKTLIQPIQKRIANALDEIWGATDTITIKPFSIDWSEDAKTQEVN